MNAEHDDLDELLAPRPASVGEPTARELFDRTCFIPWRTIRLRWMGRALAAAACLAVGYGVRYATAPAETVTIRIEAPAAPVPEAPPSPREAQPEPSALQLEMRAELSDDSAEVAVLFRQAGDKYLDVERDYPRATRCYRMHLRALNQKNPPLDAEDSWLLASLKPQPR